MPGKKLIENAADTPERAELLRQAHDLACQALVARFGEDRARTLDEKLAGILVMLARSNSVEDPEKLKDRALGLLLREDT